MTRSNCKKSTGIPVFQWDEASGFRRIKGFVQIKSVCAMKGFIRSELGDASTTCCQMVTAGNNPLCRYGNNIEVCTEPLQEFTKSQFASTQQQLEEVCPAMIANLRCVDDFALNCVSTENRMALLFVYAGVRSVISNLCREGPYRDEYLAHAECLWKDEKLYEQCSFQYEKGVKLADTSDMRDEDVQKQLCCAFHSFARCSNSLYLAKCGPKTAQFMEKYWETIIGPLIKEICVPYQSNNLCSLAAANRPSFLSILLSVLGIVTIAQWRDVISAD